MVDIGDRSLLLRCRGSGGPTVALEAGLADDLSTWDAVQAPVSARTRVCAYNRANIGVSDAAPKPRTTTDMVDDLEHLLAAAIPQVVLTIIGSCNRPRELAARQVNAVHAARIDAQHAGTRGCPQHALSRQRAERHTRGRIRHRDALEGVAESEE
jgi:hypothetical protein